MGLFHMLVSSAGVLVSPLWLVPQIYVFALCTLPLRTLRSALSLVGLHFRPQLLAEFAIVLYQYVAVAFALGAAAGAANWVLFWFVSGTFSWIDHQLRFDTGSIMSWIVGSGDFAAEQQKEKEKEQLAATAEHARTKQKYEKHPCRAPAPEPAPEDTTTDTTAATGPATPPASKPVVAAAVVTVPVPDPAPAAEVAPCLAEAPAEAPTEAPTDTPSAVPPALPDRPTLPPRDEILLSNVRHTVTTQTRTYPEDTGSHRSRAPPRVSSYDADTTATTVTGVSHSTVSVTTNSSFQDDENDGYKQESLNKA